MTRACSLCGAIGPVHRHHVSGRPAPGCAYLDPGLVVAVCAACHANLHQALRLCGLDFGGVGPDSVAHRLRRVAVTADLLAGASRPLVLAPPSARALAGLLRDAAHTFDRDAVPL